MKFRESTLSTYAAPLSESEDQKCKNAIRMVRDALTGLGFSDDGIAVAPLYSDTYAYGIEMRDALNSRKLKIFIQGSYANNTNVRTQSDVDIAIVELEPFNPVYRPGVTNADYGFDDAQSRPKSFKDEVLECLRLRFGNDVERKNKSIKINGNTFRKDTDTVPCRRYRDYRNDYRKDPASYIGGIYITADDGEIIINYPEQHIVNGRKKNSETNYYYKKIVRIIKTIRNLMDDAGYASARNVKSFGLESLLWNIPNEIFLKYASLGFITDEVINYVLKNRDSISRYKEANGIKPLCPSISDATAYISFFIDLRKLFDYDTTEA